MHETSSMVRVVKRKMGSDLWSTVLDDAKTSSTGAKGGWAIGQCEKRMSLIGTYWNYEILSRCGKRGGIFTLTHSHASMTGSTSSPRQEKSSFVQTVPPGDACYISWFTHENSLHGWSCDIINPTFVFSNLCQGDAPRGGSGACP
ncbi:unnamed protein product, partial [Discosporangium mesarthrocarpum]